MKRPLLFAIAVALMVAPALIRGFLEAGGSLLARGLDLASSSGPYPAPMTSLDIELEMDAAVRGDPVASQVIGYL